MNNLILVSGILFLTACAGVSPEQRVRWAAGAKCQTGETRTGYESYISHGDTPCSAVTQHCANGTWPEPAPFTSCQQLGRSCDGQPDGSIVRGYLQPITPKGVPCPEAAKTCVNGSWSGPHLFETCTET